MPECIRCVYDEKIPGISFDYKGLCSYCQLHDEMVEQFPNDMYGRKVLTDIFSRIKEKQKKKDYDVVLGISGGCDSSYLLHLAVKRFGLRTATFHYDNGFNSDIASKNMLRLVSKLEVPLWVYKVNKKEMISIYRAFIFGGVQDLEAPTDLGLTKMMYMAADKFNTKYILNGHSFRTEGIAPLGWSYMDGRYIKDICDKFSGLKEFTTYPNLYLYQILWYALKGYKRIRPLYYVPYNKADVKKLLQIEYGWEWYGGHHLESIITTFFVTYYRYIKFGYDSRLVEYSALIRDGQMTKPQAYELLKDPMVCSEEVIEQVADALDLSPFTLKLIVMNNHKKDHTDFKNYKKAFHLLKPLFWLMNKRNMITKSFYVKYCK